jgi:8-oxo-dGTP pyrophosphatase MutT (NUDIX family)
MSEKTVSLNWFETSEILPEHQNTEIRQVSAWVVCDGKVMIVSKNAIKWTIPGGHPESGETTRESLNREVWEESGIDISNANPVLLGYYHVTETTPEQTEIFLQLRFKVEMPEEAVINAKPSVDHEIAHNKLVTINEIPYYIAWADNASDYKSLV